MKILLASLLIFNFAHADYEEIEKEINEADKKIIEYIKHSPEFKSQVCVKEYVFDCPEQWAPFVLGGFVLGLIGGQILYPQNQH